MRLIRIQVCQRSRCLTINEPPCAEMLFFLHARDIGESSISYHVGDIEKESGMVHLNLGVVESAI